MEAADFHRTATTADTPMPAMPGEPMTASQRAGLATAIEDAMAARLLPSPRHSALQEQLWLAYGWSQRERGESRTIVAVDGPNAVGKSTAVRDWAHQVHRQHLGGLVSTPRPRWFPREGVSADQVPVVWLSLTGRQNAAGIFRKILAYLGHGTRGSGDLIEIAASRALATHGVRLLVLDDVHMLNTRLITGLATLAGVKTLNDMLSDSGGTLLVVGAHIAGGALLEDPQIAGRVDLHTLQPYAADSKPDIAEWQRLIKCCQPLVAPYLPDAGEDCLLGHSRVLWERSQGHVRDVNRLLAEGVAGCVRDGRAVLTEADFAAVRVTKRALDRHTRLAAGSINTATRPVRGRRAS